MLRILLPLFLVLPFASASPAQKGDPIPVLIVSGANNHDWEWTTPSLQGILEETGRFRVDITYDPDETLADPTLAERYRAVVLDYNGPRWGDDADANFLAAVRGGMGVTVIHAANNAFPGWKEYEELVALCWRQGTGHGRYHSFDVRIRDRTHPITRRLGDLVAHPDELYHRLVHMHDTPYTTLATALSDPETGGTGEHEPMITVKDYGDGRIFHTPLGHVWRGNVPSRRSHLDPQFRTLVARGTEWAATGDVRESTTNRLSADERANGWVMLFDGEEPTQWRGYKRDDFPTKGWEVADGALHVLAGGGGGDIITRRKFENFEFALEWKVAEKANSGIMYRVAETQGASWHSGPEFQIIDDTGYGVGGDAANSAGALYALYQPVDKQVKPAGEWNTARIRLDGGRVEHWINGRKVVEAQIGSGDWNQRVAASKFKAYEPFGRVERGHIALQDHGNDVWYRNIRVRELRPEAIAAPVELFNRENLDGWSGWHRGNPATGDVWSVKNGILHCAGKPAGYLQTDAEYTNYLLEVEWRWDPETKKTGNSGVLLRKTGKDQTWPRSLEAQLQSGRAGDFWAIEGFPMRGEPSRRNGRNTRGTHANEHPPGEWNRYEILVDGDDVVLKVNGEVLNEATSVEVVAGRICLQSEGTPIQFRRIRLTPLAK